MSRFILFLFISSIFSVSLATPLTKDKIPEPLKPWADWVLQGEEQFQCPFFYNNFQQKQCSWPGKLSLELKPKQAQFTSQWQVYREGWITLPGNQDYWPQNVTINNKAALVMNRQSEPAIKLAAGKHKIKGFFFWDRIPESLAIPKNTGLFSLKVNGKKIAYPLIKGNLVWLKESDIGQTKPKSVENKLELQVFRKVYDNVPLQLISYFELEVSGDQREIKLPHALLKDFIPISLKSPLPARIEPGGGLLIQVRPGRWHVELHARHPQYITQLALNINDTQWPDAEIWSFQAQPFQRLVEIEKLKTIDPSQSNVPRQWKNLPAYHVKQGDSMGFKVIRRGDPEPEPNQLNLKRQLWLDFNGDAYTVSDSINGKMTKGWRLDALPETQLGQVKLNGQNLLITTSVDSNKQGVEVRKGNIAIQADSRIKGDIGNISAIGWEQNFHQVQADLNIPPGWRLLAANGVDNVPDSWISQWTLLDLFLVLIAALAISRMWSIYWGVFALISLSLIWHEAESPHFIWLNILAAIALIRVLPTGKFQKFMKWYKNICLLALLIIAIPFMVSQVRTGLYPQLEKQWQKISPTIFNMAEPSKPAMSIAMEAEEADMMSSVTTKRVHSKLYKAKGIMHKRIDPDANIQTGPGLPQWKWKKIRLSWNGSVDDQQQISFWYLSPAQSMLLNFLRVLLLLVLSLLMFGVVNKKFKLSKPIFSWVLLIPLLSLPVQDVQADFPQQELLDELQSRLLQAPDCLPVCAQIPQMQLHITAKKLSISLQVHAQQAVAIPLPAKLKQWLPNQVLVNGRQARALIRTRSGELWISLEKGQNKVELLGITPVHNKFSLPLLLKPHQTTVETKGWNIEGVHDNGRTDNQLIFSRVKTVQQLQTAKQTLEPGVLPAFIRIERTLHLGLDWRITTRVIRVFNNDAALAIKLPLLKGESVTTSNIRVKNKQVLINLSSRQNSLQWQSVLTKSEQIDLIAADTHQWTEVWRADVSPIWHVQTSGIAVVHHQDHGRWLPEWRPWPNEKVSLTITRPKAVKGATLTIDRTDLNINPGKRSIQTLLNLSLRSSKGVQHTLTLPENVQLQSVKINGVTQPIRQQKSQVTLPIKPGKQDITLNWRKMQEQSGLLTTPKVNLGIASVNNHININLGQDRWVLFTSGPKFGPAVLFWGVLFVIAVLSIGLGKISLTPLKHWHWFLLLVGLSQIPVESALLVVIWLMALGFREKKQLTDAVYFNLTQIALGLLTLTSLLLLFIAVRQGLLNSPDMQIVGNQSSAFNLNWYQDRSDELLPTATVISVPLMTYRILMLLWSLWLAVSLLNWLKWGWSCYSTNGLWKKKKVADKKTTTPST
ncbi:MAG: hypothetical protein KAT04_09665 [Methylococcales bacterium]|nr:hypothetical protein [Methylococcales bacterium]